METLTETIKDNYIVGYDESGTYLFFPDSGDYYDISSLEEGLMYIDTDPGLKLTLVDLRNEEIEEFSEVYKNYNNLKKYQELIDDCYNKFYNFTVPTSLIDRVSQIKNKEIWETKNKLKAITTKVYGDNVRFVDEHNDLIVYILFPEINVSNNVGQSHDIKNIVVKLHFNIFKNSYKLAGTIEGTRLTYGNIEENCNYAHSHLPRSSNITKSFSAFCLGATEIAAMNMDLSIEKKYSDDKYILFLHMIENYLKHESLEGVPYIKLSSISPYGRSFILNSTVRSYLDTIKITNFSLNYTDNCFKVIVTENTKKEILENLKEKFKDSSEYMVYIKDGNEYSKVRNIDINRTLSGSEEVNKVSKLFNIPLSLYDDSHLYNLSDNSYQLSRQVIDTVVSNLSTAVNNFYNKKYANN